MTSQNMHFLEINRADIKQHRIVTVEQDSTLPHDHVLLNLDRFALTSNNISYALSGDFLDYWGFFPTTAGWGRLPAMGFGIVEQSNNPDIAVGGRYFGFFPVGSHSVVHAKASSNGFIDMAPHREKHAMAYRSFDKQPDAEQPNDNASLIFRGLFLTSFLAEDFLRESNYFDASQVIITSASSKTSIALAHCIRTSSRMRTVGLTSPANIDFVRSVNLYDEVLTYDDITSLDQHTKSVLVDMAGNRSVVARTHKHLGLSLLYSSAIGATHWEQTRSTEEITGPPPQFFFAPSQLSKRGKEWGRDELNKRMDDALGLFIGDSHDWLTIEHHTGMDAVSSIYQQLVSGVMRPEVGNILSF